MMTLVFRVRLIDMPDKCEQREMQIFETVTPIACVMSAPAELARRRGTHQTGGSPAGPAGTNGLPGHGSRAANRATGRRRARLLPASRPSPLPSCRPAPP